MYVCFDCFGAKRLPITGSELVCEICLGKVKCWHTVCFTALLVAGPCSEKAGVTNSLAHSSILNCCY